MQRYSRTRGPFLKSPGNFSSVLKDGEVYAPEMSCMTEGTSDHTKNMLVTKLCNRRVPDFAMALLARKVFGAFVKKAPRKPFLVHLYLKTEKCVRLKLLV